MLSVLVLEEDPGSTPRAYIVATLSVTPVTGHPILSSDLCSH